MSTSGRLYTDGAVDRELARWLSDGPTALPDASLDAALLTVSVTRQRGGRGRVSRVVGATPLVPVGLTLGVIAAVLTLAIGLGPMLPFLGTEATPTPGSTGTPTPDASTPASGRVVYTNEEDGYELTLPASWTPAEYLSNPPGTMRFGAGRGDSFPSSFGALTVSIGSTDGTVYDCAPSACRAIVATTIDELDAAIASGSNQTDTPEITTVDVDVTLDGEPARLEYVTFGGGLIWAGPQFHHLFAIHNGRPIVLSFDKYRHGMGGQANDISWVESLMDSFRFLEFATDELSIMRFATAGFEIGAPDGWQAETVEDSTVVTLEGGGSRLEVGIGDAAGPLLNCEGLPCGALSVSSLDALVESIAPESQITSGQIPGPGMLLLNRRSLVLGGDEAARLQVTTWSEPYGPATRYYIVAIHAGEPVILAWHPASGAGQLLGQILDTFRFLDSATPTP
jgi:hypothetical protein